ncbi:hypothetical protein phiPsa267_121 [Pseudomonas phage phiPsa267]|uniref:Uncharacterized protein n=2 Tax=Otagovirus TaxID=2560197 RepID=A0A7G9V143_9CAUD|nr:hypothetical protein QGX18_gp107 [Pseudomonas phage phiPsa347]YP_010767731.1 hypothetical protein QGX19_gp109 [Pseudomonas phage phiPsa267]QNN99998.1 hypothetical protein phiPsa267_121 [Pseudomonas phage phiPsa267]QNO00520.1 hypothetical protein phiPsa347_121 [Pseudomonas phage phiPsa347]
MWPFKKKEQTKQLVNMFDMDKVRELDALTPEQVVSLVCMSVGVRPENAVLYSLYDCVKPLTRQVEV